MDTYLYGYFSPKWVTNTIEVVDINVGDVTNSKKSCSHNHKLNVSFMISCGTKHIGKNMLDY